MTCSLVILKVNCLLLKLNRKSRKLFLSSRRESNPQVATLWSLVRSSNHWATRTPMTETRMCVTRITETRMCMTRMIETRIKRLGCVWLGWRRLGCVWLGWQRLGCVWLGWQRLACVWLGWQRLGCVCLGWQRLRWQRRQGYDVYWFVRATYVLLIQSWYVYILLTDIYEIDMQLDPNFSVASVVTISVVMTFIQLMLL